MRKKLLAKTIALSLAGLNLLTATSAFAYVRPTYITPAAGSYYNYSDGGGVTWNDVYYPNGYWQDGIFYPQSSWANMPGKWVDGDYYPYGYGYNSYDPYINSYVYYPYGSYYTYTPTYYVPDTAKYDRVAYPYGYYPYGYYTGQVVAESSLGGVTVPNTLVTQAAASNKNLGFVLRGQNVEDVSDAKVPVTGRNAYILDFSESIGRDVNQNISLTFRAVGNTVDSNNQAAISMMGKLQNFIDARDLGIGSISYADKDCNAIVTINVRDAVSSIQKAINSTGADKNDTVVFETVPILNATTLDEKTKEAYDRLATTNSNIYQVNVYIIQNNRRVNISDNFGDVYMRVKANDTERSLLSYYSIAKEKFTVADKASFVLDQGTQVPSAYGYVPTGQAVVVSGVKAK